jgi:hypothetical protein
VRDDIKLDKIAIFLRCSTCHADGMVYIEKGEVCDTFDLTSQPVTVLTRCAKCSR